jgi:hypothetical protein
MPQARKLQRAGSISKVRQKPQQQKRENLQKVGSRRAKGQNPRQKPVQQVSQTELEDGWMQYGGFGTRWEPEVKNKKHPAVIQGMITDKRILEADGKKFKKAGGYVTVSTAEGDTWSVGKSAAIAGWFDAIDIGDEVMLKYGGMQKMNVRGHQPMKVITALRRAAGSLGTAGKKRGPTSR